MSLDFKPVSKHHPHQGLTFMFSTLHCAEVKEWYTTMSPEELLELSYHLTAQADYFISGMIVRVPMLDDVTKFPITFRAPARTTLGVTQHVKQITHNTAFAALP